MPQLVVSREVVIGRGPVDPWTLCTFAPLRLVLEAKACFGSGLLVYLDFQEKRAAVQGAEPLKCGQGEIDEDLHER